MLHLTNKQKKKRKEKEKGVAVIGGFMRVAADEVGWQSAGGVGQIRISFCGRPPLSTAHPPGDTPSERNNTPLITITAPTYWELQMMQFFVACAMRHVLV